MNCSCSFPSDCLGDGVLRCGGSCHRYSTEMTCHCGCLGRKLCEGCDACRMPPQDVVTGEIELGGEA